MYTPKKFDSLLGLEGFSDNALKTHFGLYEGYVTNTNKVQELLDKLRTEEKTATPEYAELKRRFAWEWNGMRLHEIYFESLSKNPTPLDDSSSLGSQIKQDFGSFEEWQKDFTATAAMRGIGWAILYWDPIHKKLTNNWVNEHYVGHMSGAIPLLPCDVFEHAFMIDYGTKRADYIAAFLKAVDWKTISDRF
ncbi:MAG: superoxide dismutase [Candidatus Harrisonbacteria bacterium CG10_big_fil_rev_8_21_14_0_10_40_38]|uniref:superoxide dismutase n=1 Tax=Candidatus Harrisonbacteria bacterium CG10_big_fil_rev_8_21_14_0_10_40_38 TaxID=1974583 RepID=A0A2H0UU02_9BACT|nr:MAG: superoxide dismutase [Candidatus Harrisonbacteria bacterium CG10_big_fil_rev_8_21_14_0_10_40_38]